MNWLDITLGMFSRLRFLGKACLMDSSNRLFLLLALVPGDLFLWTDCFMVSGIFMESGWFSGKTSVVMSYIIGFSWLQESSHWGWLWTMLGRHTPWNIEPPFRRNFGVLITTFFSKSFINFYETIDKENKLISKQTKENSRFYYFTGSLVPTFMLPFIFSTKWTWKGRRKSLLIWFMRI